MVFFLQAFKKKGFSPLDYRYMCLTTHYRSPLIFTIENLESARNSYQRLKNIMSEIRDDKKTNKNSLEEFKKAIENDLNIPKALQVLWSLVRDEKAQGKYQTIKKMDEVLGLKLLEKETIIVPAEVLELVEEREKARKEKNWKKADELRKKVNELGYQINDTENGAEVKKK